MKFGLSGLLWGRPDELDTDYLRTVPMADTVTTGVAPTAMTLTEYRTNLVSSGSAGTETVTMPSGEYPGQRKLLWFLTRTHASDKIGIAVTNVEEGLIVGMTPGGATAFTLDAAGDYALLEWTGAKWTILYHNGTLTT
jgi:hypothetical protein